MDDNFRPVTFPIASPGQQGVQRGHGTTVPPRETPQCHRCGQRFRRESELKRHMGTVHNPSAVKRCPVTGCEATANRADKMRRHVKDQHPGVDFRVQWLDLGVLSEGSPLNNPSPPPASTNPLPSHGILDTQTESILLYSLACLRVIPQSPDDLTIGTRLAIQNFLGALGLVSNSQGAGFQRHDPSHIASIPLLPYNHYQCPDACVDGVAATSSSSSALNGYRDVSGPTPGSGEHDSQVSGSDATTAIPSYHFDDSTYYLEFEGM
ncbi:MAG: hypothetical protein M1839_006942 [Geoglossum umbratile]|nr:MAG: hypothetical protein M1839_006942 [Geoglossum umbratile]